MIVLRRACWLRRVLVACCRTLSPRKLLRHDSVVMLVVSVVVGRVGRLVLALRRSAAFVAVVLATLRVRPAGTSCIGLDDGWILPVVCLGRCRWRQWTLLWRTLWRKKSICSRRPEVRVPRCFSPLRAKIRQRARLSEMAVMTALFRRPSSHALSVLVTSGVRMGSSHPLRRFV